ncbi:LacI family DNA-binding transcriptional regulator [Aneurinibacillus terranovensis]|uniref:LacI family DNA-binding transcriptional regulator n=1 Tax=Aneurinibacillus terranovensis TaxID=278991 RepID=UPI0004037D7A|nr:LacI family DNA-binding transcriptional regulator [Aneurinibacillus terranovensis]
MANIRDVSKLAGVSVATVSRVLNQNGYVHPDTEQKVLKAINELNYIPNFVARSLSNKKTKTIGLIVPDITNPFFPELARAVEDVMKIYGYTVILCNSDEDEEKEKHYFQILKQKYIDGLILATASMPISDMQAFDVPIVVIDRIVSQGIPTVVAKNKEGARLATRLLLKQGCKKVAHLRGPESVINARERCEGYVDVVREKEWFHPNLIIQGNYEIKKAFHETMKLLTEQPDVDGIFAGNDLMAIGAMKAAQQLKIRIPDELAIIGFDGITLGEMIFPELSTVAQPIYDMGAIGARMLIKLIENSPVDKLYQQLDVQFIERGTTRKVCD